MNKFKKVPSLLFQEGWVFFLPYLILYGIALVAGATVNSTRFAFTITHFFTLILLVIYVAQTWNRWNRTTIFFWSCLFLVCLLPGAYLEYPTDPWEHYRRIYSWGTATKIQGSPIERKFAYFWAWTILGDLPILNRKWALDLYSAFWQVLLAFQFYRLLLRFGIQRNWALLAISANLVLQGSNIFNFRYYALSSTPLAYIAYLRILIVVQDILDHQKKAAFALPGLVGLIFMNHLQEEIFAVIGAITLIYVHACKLKRYRKPILTASALIFIGSLLWGAWLRKFHLDAFHPIGIDGISRFGTFRLWKVSFPYLETLGIHGLLGLAFALIYFRRYPSLSALTCVPVGLLLFPPFVLLIAMNSREVYDSYRILYLFPSSILLTLGLRELFERRFSGHTAVYVGLVLFTLSAPPSFPFRGRLWFQFYRPSSALNFESLHETSQWFKDHTNLPDDCMLLTDDITQFVVSADLGREMRTDRIRPKLYSHYTDMQSIYNLMNIQKLCGILVPDLFKVPIKKPTLAARLSGHWSPDFADLHWMYSRSYLPRGGEELVQKKGWKKANVPPFYTYYYPPEFSRSYGRLKIEFRTTAGFP